MTSSSRSSRALTVTADGDATVSALLAQASATALGSHPDAPSMELLTFPEVEERTGMRRSNIYRLIALGLFPAPIHLGGSKWIAAEVDEFIARKRDERDRLRGANNFAPRPAILAGLGTAVHASENAGSPAPPPSTVRILDREMVDALRVLHVEIPELYLDPSAFNVSLAVVKVELPSSDPAKPAAKRNKR